MYFVMKNQPNIYIPMKIQGRGKSNKIGCDIEVCCGGGDIYFFDSGEEIRAVYKARTVFEIGLENRRAMESLRG